MKRIFGHFIAVALLVLVAHGAQATPLRAFVSEFAVTGAANKDELKTTLQTLLASRLNGDTLVSVDSPVSADIVVKGSYIVFGKVFSLDVVARDRSGKVIARSFQQGESQDEMIPALTKLGHDLTAEIAGKGLQGSPEHTTVATVPAAPSIAPPATDIVHRDTVPATDIIKPEEVTRTASGGWVSQRLTGSLSGMAPGRQLPDGSRELYISDEHNLRLYHQGNAVKLIAEVTFPPQQKVLSIDAADLDGDGTPEIYLTIMDGESLSSQVWIATDSALKQVAANLPYYFREIALDGLKTKIYAQQMSTDKDFYGDVYELVKNGTKYELKNPIKLPRFGYLYNFNRFRDATGNTYYLVLNSDEYLIVYSNSGEELWRSSDKFGGSEMYFKREDMANIRTTGDQYRWIFLEQRITVTPDGTIIVPQNTGTFVIGNSRAYRKSSLFAFAWNGSALDEKWHTRQSQNYLADYYYDTASKELVLLEVVKNEGLFSSGASVIAVKKVQ